MFKSLFKYTPKKRICNAPFASMYFRPDGSVTPCCYNSKYIYGKYPENTVQEIWQGDSIKAFRELMINNDLSHGCLFCKIHITNNNIEAAGLQHFENLQLNKNKPVRFEFELSLQCNLKCIMCFQPKDFKSNAKIYDTNFRKQILEFLPFLKGLEFYGGEPFIIEIYYQLWELVNKTNPECIIHVQTNGTIWNERIKNIIEHGKFDISVSLDSVDEHLYENIRVNAKLNQTLENVYHFNNYMKSNNDKLSIAVCPMRNNAYNIPDIIRFATNINANIYFHTVFIPPQLSLINYPKKELELILKYYHDFLTDFQDISDQNKKSLQNLINQIKSFVINWEKSYKLIELNKDSENCYLKTINELEKYFENEEISIIRNKLNYLFSETIKTFPVVYGINHVMNNSFRDFFIDLLRNSNDHDLLEYFICYTLFSIE